MDIDKTKGYEDQELLLRAFVAFVSKHITRSEQIVKGIMRQSIDEYVKKTHVSFKEIKHLEETERLRIASEIIDIFLDKIKHIVASKFQRDKLKKNALQIYDQWKKTKRKEGTGE